MDLAMGLGDASTRYFTKSVFPATKVHGLEYETVSTFGALCMNFDIDSIVRTNHLCNQHGIDTISAGMSIAFATHLCQ